MSFSDRLATAIAAAHTYARIDLLSREVAAAWGAKVIGDAAAQAALEALEANRRSLGDNPYRPIRKPLCGLRRPPRPRSPDREASIRRRRREIAPSTIPPQVAEHFTPGQLSALAVIARDIAINGQCAQCIDKIAALAGVCPRVVQTAQRLAEQLGFLSIEERRRPGKKNLTNVITVTSSEWAAWLRFDRVNQNACHGKRMKIHTFTARKDPASWRFDHFDPAGPAPLGLAMKWSREATPLRPGARAPVERNERLEAALARFGASVRAR